jgi:hypothetical protein
MNRLRVLVLLPGAALLAAACASTPPPEAELARARALVSQATPEATRHAPELLFRAREKLAAAEVYMGEERYEQARRAAEQAAVDARLAESAADHERMRSALAEVNAGIQALRNELDRRQP